MAYLFNDPADFTVEMTRGFAAAYPQWVRPVRGGVVRSAAPPAGQVAVVIGGGSGHYPAFAGLVGPGLAHGAAMGNVFASPSAHQVHSVARAAQNAGGVLLTYGNYAGDVLNFNDAQEQLRAEGIPCRTVVVTDDIASAPRDERDKRRGIAGDLVVFKAAAGAAEEGRDLADVAAVAAHANSRTFTLGVAFGGCTLPGAGEPLFTVAPGRMAVGMGIHGEPGIDEVDRLPAAELGGFLVDRLLAERPDAADGRVVAILNGLGAVKYEELFVLWDAVARTLNGYDITVVEPDIGEMVTSFEMAGVSLTIAWVDDELARYWRSPASTPAYRKGSVASPARFPREVTETDPEPGAITAGSEESQALAAAVARGLAAVSAAIEREAEALGALDAVAGDGDHGIGMQRGARAASTAAAEAVDAGAGAGSTLVAAADAWADHAGGTSGALWGKVLSAVGQVVGDDDLPSLATLATGVRAACEAVQEFGAAAVGDKTMVDALVPYADTFAEEASAGASLPETLDAAARAARRAADATADLVPRKGRARPHAAKSVGTPDPGAVSFALIARTIAGQASHERNEGAG